MTTTNNTRTAYNLIARALLAFEGAPEWLPLPFDRVLFLIEEAGAVFPEALIGSRAERDLEYLYHYIRWTSPAEVTSKLRWACRDLRDLL